MLVVVHIYDVADELSKVNYLLRKIGTGAFHAGVEVYGNEWSFGYIDEGTGVFGCEPGKNEMFRHVQTIVMGTTNLSKLQVDRVLSKLAGEWPGSGYDLLERNCCHFSNTFCKELHVGQLPTWVTSLARIGAAIAHAKADIALKVKQRPYLGVVLVLPFFILRPLRWLLPLLSMMLIIGGVLMWLMLLLITYILPKSDVRDKAKAFIENFMGAQQYENLLGGHNIGKFLLTMCTAPGKVASRKTSPENAMADLLQDVLAAQQHLQCSVKKYPRTGITFFRSPQERYVAVSPWQESTTYSTSVKQKLERWKVGALSYWGTYSEYQARQVARDVIFLSQIHSVQHDKDMPEGRTIIIKYTDVTEVHELVLLFPDKNAAATWSYWLGYLLTKLRQYNAANPTLCHAKTTFRK